MRPRSVSRRTSDSSRPTCRISHDCILEVMRSPMETDTIPSGTKSPPAKTQQDDGRNCNADQVHENCTSRRCGFLLEQLAAQFPPRLVDENDASKLLQPMPSTEVATAALPLGHGPQFEYGTPKLPESRGVTFQTRIHWSNVKFCWVFAFRVTEKELIIPSSKHSPTSQTPKFPLHIIITSSCPNLKMQWKFRGSGIICSSASVYQHVICQALSLLLLGPGRMPTISPNQKHVTKATRPKPKRIPGAPKKS